MSSQLANTIRSFWTPEHTDCTPALRKAIRYDKAIMLLLATPVIAIAGTATVIICT